jgi:glycosyltransferase involved in cell wall biosynthesis
MNKLVSVIIPTYKRPDTLTRSIESVLNQDYDNVEVIVADDNGVGTEFGIKTAEIMKQYADNPRVKYVQHEHNINGSAARNSGFRASSGEYIMFLDDDDEFLPKKVSSQIKRLEQLDESWGACYSNYIKVTNDGKRLFSRSKESKEGNLLVEELKRNLFVAAGSNLMVRRNVIEEIGGFNENFLRNQDVEFLVKILKKYKLAYCNALGLKVYVHPKPPRSQTFEQITERFLESFRSDIEALSDHDKTEVYKMIDLQLFRSYLKKRNTYKKAFLMIRTRRVNPFLALAYYVHLAYRKIFKVSSGFHI